MVVQDGERLNLAPGFLVDAYLHEVDAYPVHRAGLGEPLDVLAFASHHGPETAGTQYLVRRRPGDSRTRHHGNLLAPKVPAERLSFLLQDGRFGGLRFGAYSRSWARLFGGEEAAVAILELIFADFFDGPIHFFEHRSDVQKFMGPLADELVAFPQIFGRTAVRIPILDHHRSAKAIALLFLLNLFKALLLSLVWTLFGHCKSP